MRITRSLILLAFASTILGMAGCGDYGPEYLVAIQTSPTTAAAVSGSPDNTVQFAAIGSYATKNCAYDTCVPNYPHKHKTLTNASWSTSDSVSTTIDAGGLATCIAVNSSPATITAAGPGLDRNGQPTLIKGTAMLVCN